VRVVIDETKCQGHGRCYSLEPSLFEPKDDLGHSMVPDDRELDDGDEALRERLTRAADSCPERAISIKTAGE
jgi:ferredoxin